MGFASRTAELLRDDDCVVEYDAEEDMRSTVVGKVVVIAGYGCSVWFFRIRLLKLRRWDGDVLDNILAAWRKGYLLADRITTSGAAVLALTVGSTRISTRIEKTIARLRRRTSNLDRPRQTLQKPDTVYNR